MNTKSKSRNKGELATILTIATLVLLGVMTTLSATVLKNKKLSSKSRAEGGGGVCVQGFNKIEVLDANNEVVNSPFNVRITVNGNYPDKFNIVGIKTNNGGLPNIACDAVAGNALCQNNDGAGPCETTTNFVCDVSKATPTDSKPSPGNSLTLVGAREIGGDCTKSNMWEGGKFFQGPTVYFQKKGESGASGASGGGGADPADTSAYKAKRDKFIWDDNQSDPVKCSGNAACICRKNKSEFCSPGDVGSCVGNKWDYSSQNPNPPKNGWGCKEISGDNTSGGDRGGTVTPLKPACAEKCATCINGTAKGKGAFDSISRQSSTARDKLSRLMTQWCSEAGVEATRDCNSVMAGECKEACSATASCGGTTNVTPPATNTSNGTLETNAAANSSDLVVSGTKNCTTKCDEKINIRLVFNNSNSESGKYATKNIKPQFSLLMNSGQQTVCNFNISGDTNKQEYIILGDNSCLVPNPNNSVFNECKIKLYINEAFLGSTNKKYLSLQNDTFKCSNSKVTTVNDLNISIPKQDDDQGNGQQSNAAQNTACTFEVQASDVRSKLLGNVSDGEYKKFLDANEFDKLFNSSTLFISTLALKYSSGTHNPRYPNGMGMTSSGGISLQFAPMNFTDYITLRFDSSKKAYNYTKSASDEITKILTNGHLGAVPFKCQ